MDRNKLLRLDTIFTSKAYDEDTQELMIEGYANTTDKDRVGDVIVREAWETKNALTNYLKNPIILAYHDHSKPIGKMVEYAVTDKGLRIRAKISKGAGEVYQLIKDGILQAFSVGFRVLDADFDSATDIFVIKDLELHEVSVVSVPCNQESVFAVSKSFEDEQEYAEFKSSFIKESESEKSDDSIQNLNTDNTEEFLMDPIELQALIAKSVADAVASQESKRIEAEAKAKELAEKAASEEARIAAVVSSNTAKLVADIEAKMKSSAEESANMIASMQSELKAKSEEIAQILAAREANKMSFSDRAGSDAAIDAKKLEQAFILSMVTKKGMFETKFGQEVVKAVNNSSSAQVSSDKYEQVVTTGLYEDMKKMLTVQPLFREIQMTSATQVLPINPNATAAGWVGTATYGTDATTGSELTKTLTEIILSTYKLAGKSYITDETEEDAIIPLLPLLREQLIEAHSNEIDNALINGTNAANDPTGLISRATTAGGVKVNTTAAKADGTVKVTSKMVLQTRRGLGQWGLNLNKLAVIVSLDAYWDLLEDDNFSNLNEVGAQAIKLTGQVGAIYGMPVLVSTQMPAKAVSAAYAIIVHTDNFLVPRLRGFSIQSDYDVEKQRRVIVSTQRLGFNDIIGGQGVAIATYAAV